MKIDDDDDNGDDEMKTIKQISNLLFNIFSNRGLLVPRSGIPRISLDYCISVS
jgi:hypothetical protein